MSEPRSPRLFRRPQLVFALVLVVAATLRLVALGHVDRLHFDETYYAQDALAMVDQGVEEERPAHPPMGKWVLAAGIAAFGFEPFAWRLGAAVAGIVAVAATYVIGLQVLRDRWLAVAATALVAVDGLAITSSRIAMLDGVLAGFVALAAVFVLRHQKDAEAPVTGRSLRPAGWAVWVAGVLLGASLATKWSAIPYLVVAVVAATWVEARRRAGARGGLRATVEGATSVFVPLVVLPAVVYAASYAGMFLNYTDARPYAQRCPELDCPAPATERVAGILWHHGDLIRMHRSLEHTHPYRSSALSWAVQRRPVLSYLERCPTDDPPCEVPRGTTARIVMVGNPVLWWAALAAVPFVAWALLSRRRRTTVVAVGLGAALYVPWLVPNSGYLYYLAPLTPFAALAVAGVAGRLPRRAGAIAPWVVVAAAVAVFVFLAPIWYGVPLDADATDARLLLDSWR